MNECTSSMLLIGIGSSGCSIARKIASSFESGIRHVLVDTDARSGEGGEPFVLIGGDRLGGNGAGGDMVAARLAAEDSIGSLDMLLEGVRLAVIVTALGGGTGSGATLEAVKRLREHGIPSCVFATTPFAFEGEDRQRNARGVMTMIEESANACFFMQLDKLVGDADQQMGGAMRKAIETMSAGVTLFWNLVAKPGYIKLDTERIRHIIAGSGRGRFATITVEGEDRAQKAVEELCRSPLLLTASGPVRAMLCGVLAGDDLRLAEIGLIADELHRFFGEQASFSLATVNDEATFSGRLAVVLMLFESDARDADGDADSDETGKASDAARRRRKQKAILGTAPTGRGRFNNSESTIWNGEDLDVPTFVRRNINLDF